MPKQNLYYASFLCIVLLFSFHPYVSGQSGQPVIISGTVANGFNLGHPSTGGNAFAIDGQGNAYYTGNFNGTVDLDPGAGTVSKTNSYVSSGVIYLAKYDIGGNLVWVNTFGSDKLSSTYSDIGVGVKIDGNNNVYLIANIYGTVDFDPSAATANVVGGSGNTDGVLVKYNSSGAYQWALDVGSSTSTSDLITSIDIDKSNNIYVTGTFSPGTGVTIKDGLGTVTTLPTTGSTSPYILKVLPTGAMAWGKNANPPVGGASQVIQCAVNSTGDVYVTGNCVTGTVFNFGDASAITAPTVTGTTDGFIWKLNSSGQNTYVKFFDGFSVYIAIDASDNPIITGSFSGTSQDMDPSSTNQVLKSSVGSNDVYLIKLNPTDASAVWILTATGTLNDRGVRLTTDGTDIYAGVNFNSSPITFPLGGSTTTLSTAGGTDIAIWKVSTAGIVQWVNQIGSTGADALRGLAFYNGTVRIGANVTGSADLNPGAGTLATPASTFPAMASVTWTSSGTLGDAVALPVTLLSYDATPGTNNTVLVSWKTVEEFNSSHFIIERSNDNKNYGTMANVPGKGTFTGVSFYSYVDNNPSPGNNYYRLTQYDLDGKATDYGIKLVNIRSGSAVYKLIPNPATGGSIMLSLSMEPETGLSYRVVDLNGSTVIMGKVGSRDQPIDISRLTAGLYIIHLSNGAVLRFQRE